ncbi:MAG: 3-methyl-2-oxobutanoate hydroxymethyltransferase [Betaproteobacteria bacterium]|nr:3-methyl-2-oxobutanoate hydroxymethyltransferase [Betaproteobacteria bacterium]
MRTTLTALHKMAQEGDRITMLTCYDASFAALLDAAGVDTLLIGDSLGNVVQGHDTTLPVTLRDVLYHTECVVRGSKRAFIIADMPFGTFQVSPQRTFENAAVLMAAGAQMVKIEGGEPMAETIAFLTARGVPVCGHLGLTPQSVHQFGGYRVQGRSESQAQRLIAEAKMLQDAGAGMLVLELIPAALAREVTTQLTMPTIGIGAGVDCSGQVLGLHDMLDIYPGKKAKFVKNFLRGAGSIQGAIEAYVKEVKAGTYPGPEHSF